MLEGQKINDTEIYQMVGDAAATGTTGILPLYDGTNIRLQQKYPLVTPSRSKCPEKTDSSKGIDLSLVAQPVLHLQRDAPFRSGCHNVGRQ